MIKVKYLEFVQEVKSINYTIKKNLQQLLPFNQSTDQHILMEKVESQVEIEPRLRFKSIEPEESNKVSSINIMRVTEKYITLPLVNK